MDGILNYISEKQQAFAKLPFFSFLRDSAYSTEERFVFAPAGAPFIMAFGDLNRYTLYVAESSDPLQQIINVHSEEDSTHYRMYLQDLDTLAFDVPLRYADTLQFLWGEERKHSRLTCLLLTGLLSSVSLKQRLVIVEAVEAAGAEAFRTFAALADEHRKSTGRKLKFFGDHHKDLETGHTMGTADIEAPLIAIAFSEEETIEARRLVDTVFAQFSAMMQELHEYALVSQPFKPSAN